MARKTNSNSASRNTNSNFAPADAFLRLSVLDSKGNKHRLPKDVALYLKNHVSEQLINAQNEAASDEPIEFKLVGEVHVVDNSPKEDIKFS